MSRPDATATILAMPGGGPGVLPIVASAHASARARFRIILADANPAVANMYLPEVTKAYRLPPFDAPGYLDALIRLIRAEGVDYLYSGLDEELPQLSSQRDALAAEGCQVLLPPSAALATALDKAAMWRQVGTAAGQPETFLVDADLDADAAFDACGGHTVIKATSLRGGRSIYLPQDREEYDFRIRQAQRLHAETGARFLVQRRVVGNEYNVTTLHGFDGQPVYAVSRRKFEDREIKSTTTSAVIERRDDVIETALATVASMGLTPGFNNTEIIVDSRDDQPYLIEINGGRCAAQDENIVAAGINLVDLMAALLQGESVSPVPHPEARLASLKIRRDVIVPYETIESVPLP